MNAHVGAIERNTERILEFVTQAQAAGCDLVVFPELAICGYSPMDLMWRKGFIDRCARAVERIVEAASDVAVLVGTLHSSPSHDAANRDNVSSVSDGALVDTFNRAVLIHQGKAVSVADKLHLPSYDIYCEKRYYKLRPSIAIPRPRRGADDTTIDLDGFFGLHPALAPFKSLWDEKLLAIVWWSEERGRPVQASSMSTWWGGRMRSCLMAGVSSCIRILV